MTRATVESLRKPREKTVTVDVDGVPTEFVIQKIKAGQRKRVQAECVDEFGMLDIEAAGRLSVELCVIDPQLTADDVEHIDFDVLDALAGLIAEHSNMHTIGKLATADPEEGSEAVKSFPAEGSEPGVGDGVGAPADS